MRMRKAGPRPIKRSASRKAGTAIAVAAGLCVGVGHAGDASAFEIFGLKFFEKKDDSAEVIDPVAYSVTLTVEGADKDLEENLQGSSLLVQKKDEPVSGDLGLVIRAREDRDRLIAALYETAHYGGVVDLSINGIPIGKLPPNPNFPHQGPVPVTIRVEPGPVFTLGQVRFTGDAEQLDPANYDLVPGGEAGSNVILKAAEKMVADLKTLGHPLAKLTARDVVADHFGNKVDVTIGVEAGPQADIGPVGVTGTKDVDAGFVRRYSRVKPGDSYTPEQLKKAGDRLRELGVFSSVTVKEADTLAPDGSLPVTIEVSEGKQRYFGVGATVSSIDGFGVQGYWGHRNLFGQAEQLRFDGAIGGLGETTDVGNLDYSAGVSFTKPGAFFPAATLTASVKASTQDNTSYDINLVTAQTGLSYEMSDYDTISGGVSLEWANVTDAFGDNDYLTLSTPFEYVRDTRDNKLDATGGYRASISATPSYEILGSTPFIDLQGSLSAYRSLTEEDRIVLAGKVSIGSLFGSGSLADIPANRRFYEGGGGSVRGYAFQEISPYNGAGDATGGRSFMTGSLEARIKITDTIGIVPFFDFGTVSAANFPDFSDIRAGAGVGLRYATPFGPIRLDVAMPLNKYPGGSDYGIYAGIGQSF
nr:autotransporter assembly complex family protein [Rhizobium halophytocola]